MPGSFACCTTQSMAAITWETSVPPSAVPTFRLTIRASGAIPRYALGGDWSYGAVRSDRSRDQPGHERSRPVRVQVRQGRGLATRSRGPARRSPCWFPCQTSDRSDARIDQRDVDAVPGVPGAPPGRRSRILRGRGHGIPCRCRGRTTTPAARDATSGEIETTDGSAPIASATRWDKVAENPSMMGSSAVIEPPSDVTKRLDPRLRAREGPDDDRHVRAAPDVRVPAGVRTNAATKIVRIAPASERELRSRCGSGGRRTIDPCVQGGAPLLLSLPSSAPALRTSGGSLG